MSILDVLNSDIGGVQRMRSGEDLLIDVTFYEGCLLNINESRMWLNKQVQTVGDVSSGTYGRYNLNSIKKFNVLLSVFIMQSSLITCVY